MSKKHAKTPQIATNGGDQPVAPPQPTPSDSTATLSNPLQNPRPVIGTTKKPQTPSYDALRQKYGNLSDRDLAEISRILRDRKVCESCIGLPCQRTRSKGCEVTFKIEDGRLCIGMRSCVKVQKQRQQMIIAEKFKASQIPTKYADKTFADYKITPTNQLAVKWAKWLVKNPDNGLFIYGNPGTGKTFLAAIIANELITQGHTVIFGDVPSLLDTLKSTFRENATNSLEDLMSGLERAAMLVLDDIGTEYSTDWALERLYMIINNRYNARKPLIVTSNYDIEGLSARFRDGVVGQRIISRIAEMCTPVYLSGADWRTMRS